MFVCVCGWVCMCVCICECVCVCVCVHRLSDIMKEVAVELRGGGECSGV